MLGLKRKVKALLYRIGIHHFIPANGFIFWGHTALASKWIKENRNLGFNDFYNSNIKYEDRLGLYKYISDTEIKEGAMSYLEFGVSRGTSFKWWVGENKNPETRFYGFDTFTGLPEDWGTFKKGAMSNGNKPPEVNDDRASFYQGLFQQTLIPFLKEFKSEQKKIIHLDADIYSATLYVLTLITPFLNKGDILLFDEFNVPMHEFKAFKEWTESFYIDYEVLGAVNNYLQVAIKIK